MRPVQKSNQAPAVYSTHKTAKGDLVAQLGSFCSYCGRYADKADLHVEHIVDQQQINQVGGYVLLTHWNNFLLACSSCNSSKRFHNPIAPQKYLWPHLHNTHLAFTYLSDGNVTINKANLNRIEVLKAENTVRMLGMKKRPKVDRRKAAFAIANEIETDLNDYLSRHKVLDPAFVNALIGKIFLSGHWSIFYTHFQHIPEIKNRLVTNPKPTEDFKVAPDCFPAPHYNPVPRNGAVGI